jgi:hypothetical protein
MKCTSYVLTVVLFLLLTTFSACKKSGTNPGTPTTTIDLSLARLNDFQLVETQYTNITITHPIISNGVETQMGEIRVTVPAGTSLQLTPKTSNFTNNDFQLSPQLGVMQNFSGSTFLYTITSKTNASKQVHYTVRIVEEQTQPAQAAITAFRFERSKNPSLPADINASLIIEGVATIGKIFVFVPVGTSFTSLTPTINFQGTGLFYSQDPTVIPENVTTVYPTSGTAIDFAYPKSFYAIVRSGTEVKTYNVIVDVQSPIQFDNAAVTTANVQAGAVRTAQAGTFLNRGNHPITLAAVDHNNHIPAGISVVRGAGFVPALGLLPGNRGNVTATISAQTFPPGTYSVTASFRPRFIDHPEADNLLQPASLQITSTIVP